MRKRVSLRVSPAPGRPRRQQRGTIEASGQSGGAAMAAEAEEYESVLCVKPAVLVYRLPPRASNRGYRWGPRPLAGCQRLLAWGARPLPVGFVRVSSS